MYQILLQKSSFSMAYCVLFVKVILLYTNKEFFKLGENYLVKRVTCCYI